MVACRICGEEKEGDQFSYIPYFRKFKKNKVIWCHTCQQMYINMKKQKQRLMDFVMDEKKFIVSFD